MLKFAVIIGHSAEQVMIELLLILNYIFVSPDSSLIIRNQLTEIHSTEHLSVVKGKASKFEEANNRKDVALL